MISEERRAYNRAYYLANPDKYNKRTPERRAKHNATRRERYRTDPVYRAKTIQQSLNVPGRNPDVRKCRQYKLDQFELDMMTSEGCAICRVNFDLPGVKRHIDHDHSTGKTRGVLCQSCNLAIGHMADDPIIVASALRYLLNGGAM